MGDMAALKDRLDSGDMFGKIWAMPDHMLEGIRLALGADLHELETETFHSVVISGMGGSAIGGDIARSYLSREIPIPMIVQRHYRLPGFVNKRCLVIFSSYSGDTEETLSAYDDALSRGANILVITSGGKLGELAFSEHLPLVTIPGGLPPRAALGYSLAALLTLMFRLGLCVAPMEDIKEAASIIRARLNDYSPENENNPALSLAEKLHKTIPIIYAGQDNLDAIAARFKGQICENAKCLAFANVFPEFNHNELVGWGGLTDIEDDLSTVIIRDEQDHPRIRARMDIVGGYMKERGRRVVEVQVEKLPELSRIFLLIQLTDFASYYLALLNGVDPTPVAAIDQLKKRLSEIR